MSEIILWEIQFFLRSLILGGILRASYDFILILKSKKDCIKYKALIERFLWEHLKLELNSKSKYYPHKMGVNFSRNSFDIKRD